MSLFKKFKTFYQESHEHKTQVHIFFAFLIIPLIGITLLYVYVNIFEMTKLHYNSEGRLTDVPEKVETQPPSSTKSNSSIS